MSRKPTAPRTVVMSTLTCNPCLAVHDDAIQADRLHTLLLATWDIASGQPSGAGTDEQYAHVQAALTASKHRLTAALTARDQARHAHAGAGEWPQFPLSMATPTGTRTAVVSVEVGDFVTDGLIRGLVVGVGYVGMLPGYHITYPTGNGDEPVWQTGFLLAEQTRLISMDTDHWMRVWCPAQADPAQAA